MNGMYEMGKFNVILSVVRLDEGETNGVEGSHVVSLSCECPEILRLRKTPLSLRFASLRMTFQLLSQ
jgi:hypothetical protein